MKKITTIAVLIFIGLYGNAQILDVKIEDIRKIILVDHQNNNYNSAYGTVYELKPNADNFKLYQTERYFKRINSDMLAEYSQEPSEEKIFLKDLPKIEIQNLIGDINDRRYSKLQLEEFGYNTNYLQQNAERIAKNHHEYDKLEEDQQKYFIEQLQYEENIKEILPNCFNFWMTSDYPTCAILFVRSEDTIQVFSKQQNPYMIPWNLHQIGESYNPAISSFFASIIPHENFSNKSRLEGRSRLESSIAKQIYSVFCEPVFEIQKLEKLLKPEIELINEHFDISNVFIGSMGSLDWDAFKDGACWHVNLHDKNELDNLLFEITMENEEKTGSIKPLLEQKQALLERTRKASFLIDHIAENPKSILEIHFTKDKSFSPKAQASLLKDMPIALKNQFEKELDDTILLTLVNDYGWSRWLIYPDGQIMLWHYSGSSPLGKYTDEQIKIEGGYFKNSCKLFDTDGVLKN